MKLLYKKHLLLTWSAAENYILNLFQDLKVSIKYSFSVCLLTAISLSGCKKFIEVNAPATSINAGNVYNDDANATAAVLGMFSKLSSNSIVLNASVIPELSADNITLFDLSNLNYLQYYKNAIDPNNTSAFWYILYPVIYNSNAALEGLEASTKLTPAVKHRLMGEAYFVRAFCYFYLVNFYGEVPIVSTSDYQVNSQKPRTAVNIIYEQIIKDLNNAKNLITDVYVDGTSIKTSAERVRPNHSAVLALLARVYLYQKNFAAAEAAATTVLSQPNTVYNVVSPSSVFLKNSLETIWALQPVLTGSNTQEANLYILPASGPNQTNSVYVSSQLMASFEDGDRRKTDWIGSITTSTQTYYYSAKYKVKAIGGAVTPTEYPIVLRIAELYLIRAEARNEQHNTSGAIQDLNVLRARSRAIATEAIPDPLPDLESTLSEDQIRTAILKERRVELFTEWGHRWFDLKRTGNIDPLMTSAAVIKGGTWSSFKALYPIPIPELRSNPALTQNSGYPN